MRTRAELMRRLRALPSLQGSGCSEDTGFAASREAGCNAAATAITLLIALTSSSPTFILAISASAASVPTSLHHQRLTSTASNRHHQIQGLSFSCRERPFLSAAREASCSERQRQSNDRHRKGEGSFEDRRA